MSSLDFNIPFVYCGLGRLVYTSHLHFINCSTHKNLFKTALAKVIANSSGRILVLIVTALTVLTLPSFLQVKTGSLVSLFLILQAFFLFPFP